MTRRTAPNLGERCAELAEESEIVADSPPLGDLAVADAVHEHDLSRIVAGRRRNTEELPARPAPRTRAVVDDVFAVGDDAQLLPALGGEAVGQR
jgi:hypothetical protein